jgi:hypothetical protein
MLDNFDRVLADHHPASTTAPALAFSESIFENITLIEDLIRGMPPEPQQRAKRASMKLSNAFSALVLENIKDPAVGLGLAWAAHHICARMIAEQQEGQKTASGNGLIQLLK